MLIGYIRVSKSDGSQTLARDALLAHLAIVRFQDNARVQGRREATRWRVGAIESTGGAAHSPNHSGESRTGLIPQLFHSASPDLHPGRVPVRPLSWKCSDPKTEGCHRVRFSNMGHIAIRVADVDRSLAFTRGLRIRTAMASSRCKWQSTPSKPWPSPR